MRFDQKYLTFPPVVIIKGKDKGKSPRKEFKVQDDMFLVFRSSIDIWKNFESKWITAGMDTGCKASNDEILEERSSVECEKK